MSDDPGHRMLTDAKRALVGFLIAVATMTLPIGIVFTDAHLTKHNKNVKINNNGTNSSTNPASSVAFI